MLLLFPNFVNLTEQWKDVLSFALLSDYNNPLSEQSNHWIAKSNSICTNHTLEDELYRANLTCTGTVNSLLN